MRAIRLICSVFITLAMCSAAFAQCNARIVTSVQSFTLRDDDCALGFERAGAMTQWVKLPAKPINGKIISIFDLGGNFFQGPVTVVPNAGQRIGEVNGSALLSGNGGNWTFRFFSTGATTGVWGFSKQ